MARYLIWFMAFLVKVVYSQRILQQNYQPQLGPNNVIQQVSTQVSPNVNVMSDYSIDLCRSLANQVQSLVLNKLTRNACKKPIFNQIAGPLLNEIAYRVQGSQCPVCGNVPIQSVVNSIANAPVQSALNSLVNLPVQSYGNQRFGNPLQGFGNMPIQALVNPLGNLPCQSVNQLQSLSPCAQSQVQRLPALQTVARQVVNQNPALSPVQQKYSEALSLLNTLGSNSNCGCGQRNAYGLY